MTENKYPESIISVPAEIQAVYDLSMVIPTRNEAGNIEPLLMRIHQAVKGIAVEVVFVDDSTDETPDIIRKLQDWFPLPIKLIASPERRTQERTRRSGRRRLQSHPGYLDGRHGCGSAASAGNDPAPAAPGSKERLGYRDRQSSGTWRRFKQPGVHPQCHLTCLCPDHAHRLPPASVERDRSPDRVLSDQTRLRSSRPS